MKLADLRRVAIRTGARIRFPISGGRECVVNEHGIAQVPALGSTPNSYLPNFNLEAELAQAPQFMLEPAVFAGKGKGEKNAPPGETGARTLNREQLAALAGASGADQAREEHED
jgi:hypothetical protein